MRNFSRNDFKLTFEKLGTQFFVNEKKGIVTCAVNAYLRTPYAWNSCVNITNDSFKGIGKAQCHKDDVFDVERGKRIAMARAENEIYLAAVNYLSSHLEDIHFFESAIIGFINKAKHQCEHNKDYAQSISNPEHPNYKPIVSKVKIGFTNGKPNGELIEKHKGMEIIDPWECLCQPQRGY